MSVTNDREGPVQQFVLGLQWVVFHAGVVLSGSVILANALELSSGQSGNLIRLTLVLTGMANLVQTAIGHRRTLLEGPAVPWLSGYLVLAAVSVASGMALEVVRTNIQGAMIVAGGVLIVAGLLGVVERLRFLFTSRVTGVLLALLAVQISGVAIRGLVGSGIAMFAIGTAVLLLSILLLVRARGILRNGAILLAVAVGWAASAVLGLAPALQAQSAAVVALPRIFPWGPPTFDAGSIVALTILGLLMIPNAVGALKAIEQASGEAVPVKRYDRGLTASGLACALAGIGGGIGTAPFAISVGLVSVTKEKTNRPYIIGAVLFILIGLAPVLGSFFASIPQAIASAVLLISVSSLAVIGVQTATRETLDTRTSFVVGIGLLTGCGVMFVPGTFWSGVPYWLAGVVSNGVITGTVVAMILEQTVLRGGRPGGRV